MPRGRVAFRQADLTRALRAAKAAGLEVSSIEINATGTIVVMTAAGASPSPAPTLALDRWLANHARKTQGSQSGP